jgi:UDP-glucose 4-epimerase
MTVLVTGGAGYIGSVVARELRSSGHKVVVYDSLYKGHRDTVHPDATFVQGDVLDTAKLRETLNAHGVEVVVHMAADSLVGESMGDPAKYFRNNVVAGLSLLDAMRGAEVRKIVFSSTVSVYGEPREQPIEESAPTLPVNPYGDTKLAFERALHWYGQAFGIRYISLRYFNAAGATEELGERHNPETHLIPLVLQAAAGERPALTVFGNDYPSRDGTCIRDYIHVLDLARAHVLAVGALQRKDANSQVYNLGSGGEGTSVLEVIEAARRVTARVFTVRIGPRRDGDPVTLIASCKKIAADLGWRAERSSIEEILQSAWSWKRRHAIKSGPSSVS